MADSRDVLSLLYRADWTLWSVSALVSVRRDEPASERLADRATADLRRASGGALPPVPLRASSRLGPRAGRPAGPAWAQTRQRILIAPGGRYRCEPDQGGQANGDPARDEDDPPVSLIICDSESCWVVRGTGTSAEADRFDADPARTPFQDVIGAGRLLSQFRLTATGMTLVAGRTAYQVLATPRLTAGPVLTGPYFLLDRIDLLVDAELGVVLRREEVYDGAPLAITELLDFAVSPAAARDRELFAPPPGIDVDDRTAAMTDFGTEPLGYPIGAGGIAVSVAIAAAGFAARRLARPEPVRNANSDPEAAMPASTDLADANEPVSDKPVSDEPVSDELLSLIAGIGLPALNLTTQVHSWIDCAAAMKLPGRHPGRDQFIGSGFIGGESFGNFWSRLHGMHRAALLRVAMPDRYRVTYQIDERPRQPQVVASDADRLRKVYHNRVVTSPAEPLPTEFVRLLDPAWLLDGWRLAAAGKTTAASRPAVCLVARPPCSPRDRPADPSLRAVVIIDAELGIVLRQVSYIDDQPFARYELRDVIVHSQASEGDESAERNEFSIDTPGLPVISSDGAPLHDLDLPAGVKAAGKAMGWLAGEIRRACGSGSARG